MRILAIETSCDETAAAVVEDGVNILSSSVASSAQMHKKYGGVVPEIAAREQLRCILPVIKEALIPFVTHDDHRKAIETHIDALAVTVGPGLVGSLLIGVETVKAFAFVSGKPTIPVNHVLAHMYANFVRSEQKLDKQHTINFPAISLVVSGGHTELYLMESEKKLKWLGGTLDDAAGEAFDKTARLIGFGTGGGVAIQNAASEYSTHPEAYTFKLPRPMIHDDSLNFSFSGLKTAILREWRKYVAPSKTIISAFAFEVQEAITDVLVAKTLRAAATYNAASILLSGGVAANLRLREKFKDRLTGNVSLHIPPVSLCTDNAVYIASYAFFRGKKIPWQKLEAQPDLDIEIY